MACSEGRKDELGTRLNPLVTAFFVHFWRLVMHSLYQCKRVEDFFLGKWITSRYQIKARGEEEGEEGARGIHIDAKRINVGDNVSLNVGAGKSIAHDPRFHTP